MHSTNTFIYTIFALLLSGGLVACGNDTNAEATTEELTLETETPSTPNPPAPKEETVTVVAAAPVCNDCGTISAIDKKTEEGKGTGWGAAAGAVLGAVAGREIVGGKRSHRDAAAVAGAVGGGYAGHKIEEKARSKDYYLVSVRMDDGRTETVTLNSPESLTVGQKVRVQDGNIILR